MEKRILKLQKETDKAFTLFHKMITKLLKFNDKLEKMLSIMDLKLQENKQQFLEEEEKIGKHLHSISSMIDNNTTQISKLKSLIGKVDE